MSFKDVVNIEDLNNGAANEQFGREWRKLIGNVGDPTTESNKVRKITIEISILPTTDRSSAKVLIATKSNLAPVKSDENMVMFELTNEGIVAMTREPEKQLELDNLLEMPKAKVVR